MFSKAILVFPISSFTEKNLLSGNKQAKQNKTNNPPKTNQTKNPQTTTSTTFILEKYLHPMGIALKKKKYIVYNLRPVLKWLNFQDYIFKMSALEKEKQSTLEELVTLLESRAAAVTKSFFLFAFNCEEI